MYQCCRKKVDEGATNRTGSGSIGISFPTTSGDLGVTVSGTKLVGDKELDATDAREINRAFGPTVPRQLTASVNNIAIAPT
jgi:hypothetical protein